MRKLLVAALVVAVSGISASQALAARSVKIGDDYFVRKGSKPTVTVSKGTRVTWRWTGDDMHNVSVSRGPAKFRSDLKSSGRFSRKLRKRGTYKIICTIHAPDMAMTLKVR